MGIVNKITTRDYVKSRFGEISVLSFSLLHSGSIRRKCLRILQLVADNFEIQIFDRGFLKGLALEVVKIRKDA